MSKNHMTCESERERESVKKSQSGYMKCTQKLWRRGDILIQKLNKHIYIEIIINEYNVV